jgi:hypothetical protein
LMMETVRSSETSFLTTTRRLTSQKTAFFIVYTVQEITFQKRKNSTTD